MEKSNVVKCSNCGCIINLDTEDYGWEENDGYCGDDNILCINCIND